MIMDGKTEKEGEQRRAWGSPGSGFCFFLLPYALRATTCTALLHLFQITAVGTISTETQSEPFKAGMSDLLTEQMGGGLTEIKRERVPRGQKQIFG